MSRMTMQGIADMCGVSIKTVSRVLNNSVSVKQETRERILKVIQDEGYQVNLLARGLKQKKTNTIIVFIDKHKEKYWGIWHTQMLQFLFKEAKEKGYKIVVSPSSATGHLEDDTDGFHLLSNKMADGAIILDNADEDIRLNFLNKNKIPYVLVGQTEAKDVCWVDLDNFNTGVIGCEYLIDKGYKKIAFLLGQEQFHVNKLRADGFRQVANEQGLEHRIEFNADSMDAVYKTTLRLCDEESCDALFISGAERALGAYRALNELGLHIPKDVAILGIDNIALCQYMYPSMSTMDQQCDQFAKAIINQLYGMIEGECDCELHHILIENKIIEREST